MLLLQGRGVRDEVSRAEVSRARVSGARSQYGSVDIRRKDYKPQSCDASRLLMPQGC
jgi:hypothetical protein